MASFEQLDSKPHSMGSLDDVPLIGADAEDTPSSSPTRCSTSMNSAFRESPKAKSFNAAQGEQENGQNVDSTFPQQENGVEGRPQNGGFAGREQNNHGMSPAKRDFFGLNGSGGSTLPATPEIIISEEASTEGSPQPIPTNGNGASSPRGSDQDKPAKDEGASALSAKETVKSDIASPPGPVLFAAPKGGSNLQVPAKENRALSSPPSYPVPCISPQTQKPGRSPQSSLADYLLEKLNPTSSPSADLFAGFSPLTMKKSPTQINQPRSFLTNGLGATNRTFNPTVDFSATRKGHEDQTATPVSKVTENLPEPSEDAKESSPGTSENVRQNIGHGDGILSNADAKTAEDNKTLEATETREKIGPAEEREKNGRKTSVSENDKDVKDKEESDAEQRKKNPGNDTAKETKSNGVSPSKKSKSQSSLLGDRQKSDTSLNKTPRNVTPSSQKPRTGILRGSSSRQNSTSRSTSQEDSPTNGVPLAEEESESIASRNQSYSSFTRGAQKGNNSEVDRGEESDDAFTQNEDDDDDDNDDDSDGDEDDGKGYSEEKSLPMFFVGGDSATPTRHNSCPSERAPLTKNENGNAGTNGMGGGTDEVTKRHPPKSQNSILLNSLFMILSGLYGILIVVLGAVIPLTEIFVTGEAAAFEYFYLYLYGVSIIFLGYVYVYLLRRKRLQTEFIARTLSRSVSFTRGFATSFLQRQNSDKGRHRKRMVSLDESNHHTGTFYLRLGVLGFGIGSMIHSGLNFGKFFGSITNGQCSNGVSVLLKPLLHLIFTFSQLYFIFMNSKMCIHRYKVVARFGLMHMAATNICVWFRSIVVETLHEIHHHHVHAHDEHHDDDLHHLGDDLRHLGTDHASDHTEASYDNLHTDTENVTVSLGRKLFAVAASAVNGSGGASLGGLLEMRCSWDNMMGKAVDSAGPYLYPCTIEYSLMCAGILYVMWNNVGTRPRRRTDSEMEDDDEGDERVQRMSVDCTSSSRGLFLGIFLTVGAIISIIAFYVMVGQPHLKSQALLLTHLSETVIYFVTVFALVMASLKMRQLVFHVDHKSDLEETLIIIAYTGLLAFNIFSLIAAILMAPAEGAALTIMSNFTMMLQSALQTIFMLAGDRMSASNALQERKKPGREYVTFLLLCNFAMWMINTFETQKPEHNPLQVLFYGPEAWSIFSHISVPLGIYYRFHSTVCLSNIWKNAWKFRKHQH
ncbi:proton channel OtopLc-like isoform X1 [Littorina saxatilis]|uniref:Otopetrin-2 n=1 Tax=Littorina saxatilis TaxID=31220 RepID=A0AAN9AQC2_9CAEN